MAETPRASRSGLGAALGSEVLLGTLVALLSVLTAWSSYLGSLADSVEGDANVEGQKVLSLSNTEYLTANQDVIQDYTMYDGFFVFQDSDPERAAYYESNFSDELFDSMDRLDGPFDEAYYDDMYALADGYYDEAILKFEEARAAGERADRYQSVLLTFAVGLALAAWASVVRSESRLRPLFAIISLATLAFGLVNFLGLYLGS